MKIININKVFFWGEILVNGNKIDYISDISLLARGAGQGPGAPHRAGDRWVPGCVKDFGWFSQFVLAIALCSKNSYYAHFADKETEVRRHRAETLSNGRAGFELRTFGSGICSYLGVYTRRRAC